MSGAIRIARRVVPAVVSVAALWFLFSTVDLEEAWNQVTWKIAALLLPTLLAYGAITLVLESWSILRLVVPTPPGFGAWTAARIKCASYLLGIVHYALGAGALTVLLRRRAGLSLSEAASIVLLISAVDLLVVLGMAALGATLYELDDTTDLALMLAVGGVAFFGGLTLLRMPSSLGPLDRIRSLSVFEALRNVPLERLVELLVLRSVFSVCFIGIAGIAFAAFDLHPPVSQLVVGMMIVAVVAALPIAVAGLGTSQAAMVYLFHDLGADGSVLAMSLVLSAGMIAMRALMGLVVAREYTREALEQTRGEGA
jgi:uncharacterized membrane protein YbhN (UPF0104 family)